MSKKVCLANRDCSTGYCLSGTCTDPSSYLDPCSPTHPNSCSTATYTSSNTNEDIELVCSDFSHLCVLPGEEGEQEKGKCDTMVHCSVDKYCPAVIEGSGSGTTRKCQTKKAEGAECQRQEECRDGLECYMGYCRRRVQMLTMAECKEKEKQVAVTNAKYGVCIPEGAKAVPTKTTTVKTSTEGGSNTALWVVGGISGVVIIGLGGALAYLLYRKGYFGKKQGSSNI